MTSVENENNSLIKQDTAITVTGWSGGTDALLNNVKKALIKYFPEKALAILKPVEELQEEKKKLEQLELEKQIARHFNATYIATICHNISDTFLVRTVQGHYIVTKDKKILIWPAKHIGLSCKAGGMYAHRFVASVYIDLEDQRHIYCVDKNDNSISLPKLKHLNHIKCIPQDTEIFVMNASGETTREHDGARTTMTTPTYEYLVDRTWKKMSKPYEHINERLIIQKWPDDNCKYSKFIKKEGKYQELGERFDEVHEFNNGCNLFIQSANGIHYYHLYDKDDNLLKKVEAVQVLDSLESPYVGKDETGHIIIYEGGVYDMPYTEWFYPVLDDEHDFMGWGPYKLYNSLFVRGPENKLLLWQDGKIADLKNVSNGYVEDIFFNQAKVYRLNDHVSMLIDPSWTIIDVGHYHIPFQREEDKEFILRNHYIGKRPLSSDKYSRADQVVSSSWAISEVFDNGICDSEDKDRKLITEYGLLKVKHQGKYKLINIKTCKEVMESADEITYFMEGYIYVKREVSPKPDHKQEAFLYDGKLNLLLWPVHDIRDYTNMIKVETYESLDKPSTLDGKFPIDNADYYFPDLTPVGK